MGNYLAGVPLRIMDKFEAEQVFVVEPGDVALSGINAGCPISRHCGSW
jgi:hypothetical protein